MSLIVRPPCAMASRCASMAESRYDGVRFDMLMALLCTVIVVAKRVRVVETERTA